MSASAPKIQALAIVSPRGGPIYVRQFGKSPEDSHAADLRYHYFAHAALDVMDERSGLTPTPSSSRTSSEQYLGLLYTLEDLAIYGFQTCTRLRFLLMLSLTDYAVRDIDMLALFRALYTSWLKYSSNPFLSLPPTRFTSTTEEVENGDEGSRRAHSELEQKQAASLPVNCRQIRSAAFDARIDRIVFASSKGAAAPRQVAGGTAASAVPTAGR